MKHICTCVYFTLYYYLLIHAFTVLDDFQFLHLLFCFSVSCISISDICTCIFTLLRGESENAILVFVTYFPANLNRDL